MVCSDPPPLEELRLRYTPKISRPLEQPELLVSIPAGEAKPLAPGIALLFPKSGGKPFLHFAVGKQQLKSLKVGVFFSGGQAAGGHNVLCGLHDALQRLHPASALYGFTGGPGGLVAGKYKELDGNLLAHYRNQGGFDLLGSGRTKIETQEQLAAAAAVVRQLNLDGLVIIGGDDSNTNAALLAEYFLQQQLSCTVAGVPKTIDGDLRTGELEISFGFDTATKCYSAIIGDIARDALSAKKYYFFIKLMGRSASHVTLECALNTHPNAALIGEEIAAKGSTLNAIVADLCDLVEERSRRGKHYGVILLPEGIIEFIPEMRRLISELNENSDTGQLSGESLRCYNGLPGEIQRQLTLERDPHGNVQVSKIESERLFIAMVEAELARRSHSGPFSAQPLFCGYEGRACLPSNFDADYCYNLGLVSALIVKERATGYMAALQGLARDPKEWLPAALPIASMMSLERRKGKEKPVIEKALVDLRGGLFQSFCHQRENWRVEDSYRFPGPIQFFGPPEITDRPAATIREAAPSRERASSGAGG